jgi:calcineurin-like phosphoesterase family protein
LKGIEKKIMVITNIQKTANQNSQESPKRSNKKKQSKQFKPDILLHGHIHEAAGMEERIGSTRVINVGKEGRIIEIDERNNF